MILSWRMVATDGHKTRAFFSHPFKTLHANRGKLCGRAARCDMRQTETGDPKGHLTFPHRPKPTPPPARLCLVPPTAFGPKLGELISSMAQGTPDSPYCKSNHTPQLPSACTFFNLLKRKSSGVISLENHPSAQQLHCPLPIP